MSNSFLGAWRCKEFDWGNFPIISEECTEEFVNAAGMRMAYVAPHEYRRGGGFAEYYPDALPSHKCMTKGYFIADEPVKKYLIHFTEKYMNVTRHHGYCGYVLK
ncbi:MAG: hypothetical protein ACLRVS_02490 [Lachnospiraceae bacterium]